MPPLYPEMPCSLSLPSYRAGARIETWRRLALVLDGRKRENAARLAGMDWQASRDSVHRYNTVGMAGLADLHRCSSQPVRGTPPLPWSGSHEHGRA